MFWAVMSVTLQMSIFTQLAQSKFVEATISEIYKHKQASRGIWALKAGHTMWTSHELPSWGYLSAVCSVLPSWRDCQQRWKKVICNNIALILNIILKSIKHPSYFKASHIFAMAIWCLLAFLHLSDLVVAQNQSLELRVAKALGSKVG